MWIFFKQQMVDPALAEMGKNLNEAMKLLEDNQRYLLITVLMKAQWWSREAIHIDVFCSV